jgi:small subunit ribosomal protein S20
LTGEWPTAIPRVKHAWAKIRADHVFSARSPRFAFSKAADGAFDRSKDFPMANTSSAKKAARQMISRTDINKARRTRVKGEVRAVEEAIKAGDQGKALAALAAAEPVLARTAQKGIMHKKTASRKVSRLAQRVKAMSA